MSRIFAPPALRRAPWAPLRVTALAPGRRWMGGPASAAGPGLTPAPTTKGRPSSWRAGRQSPKKSD
eukprot:6299187-Pyramimonas_sp.AAC.1